MVYTIETVMQDVRIAIDENKTGGQLLTEEDTDTLSLDEIVRSKIAEGVRRVELAAPVYLLEEGHVFGRVQEDSGSTTESDAAIYWGNDFSGYILLPDDFMRLIAFKMSDWERVCHTAISVDDPRYDLQFSRHKGLRGNVQKPVCAIVNHPEGKALEFFSCGSENATITRAMYVPYPEIEKYVKDSDGNYVEAAKDATDTIDGIDISKRCYEAVVYTIAALTLTAYGEGDRASQLDNLAKTLLEA